MKRLLLSVAVALCALTASAQRTSTSSSSFFSTEKSDQGVTFGIEGGLNLSSATGDLEADSRTSFNVGLAVNIPLMQSLYLKTGLYYTDKGAKEKEGTDEVSIGAGYLEIPVLASYRYDFGSGTQLQVNFGPYFAYGIAGKVKNTYYDDYEEMNYTDKYDTFGDEGLLKRFDAGLHIGTGVTIANHFYVGLGYEFGLTNALNESLDEEFGELSAKTSNFFVNVGYTF